MVNDDQILEFLIILEQLKVAYERDNSEWSGCNLNFEHLEDRIVIESGWCTPEEGGEYNCIVYLNCSPIKVETLDQASTVYGDYDNNDVYTYESLRQYGNYLIEYFNILEE